MRQWVTRDVTVGSTAEWMTHLEDTTLPFELSQDPIVLDRSRKVHPGPIARKPAPMLDLFTLTVILSVQTALQRAVSSHSEGLPAPLMIEWE